MDFAEFETKHFHKLDNDTWRVIRDYCYPHGFLIDHNFDLSRTCTTVMLETIAADWYDEWTLKQIKWIEERYHTLSRITHKCKQELTVILHLNSASNHELNTARQGTQQFQDKRYQTPPPQPAYVHQLTSGYQPTHEPQYVYESQFKPNEHQPAPTRISNLARPTSKMTTMDVGRYNIRNRRNDLQLVPTRIFYPAPPTSKIRKDCKRISERSTAQTLPMQTSSSEATPVQALSAQVLPVQTLPI